MGTIKVGSLVNFVVNKMNLNENKNQLEIPKEKLEKLGILKVIGVVISEDEETKYRVITNEGETMFVPASELLSK